MIRPVEIADLENMRAARNKWYNLGIFRQDHAITEHEQEEWFETETNHGVIINDRAYGKIYDDNEVSFYGYDTWFKEDILELLDWGGQQLYYGECYQQNQFLHLWLECGFNVEGVLRNRKYWNGRLWDGLLLERHR